MIVKADTVLREKDAPIARPSATVVVLRDGSQAPEILLVKRRAGDAFGDSYAFPGGVIDADEGLATELGAGVSADDANSLLGLDRGGLDYFSAGIRELFEETGVLLAQDTSGNWATCGAETDVMRTAVDRGRLRWSDFLQQQELHMAYDALHYFAYWQTPLRQPKRWTTRFFAAVLPDGQKACHDGKETTDSCWLSAADALTQRRCGDFELPHPTIMTLKNLQDLHSIEAILAWTATQRAAGIPMLRLGDEALQQNP